MVLPEELRKAYALAMDMVYEDLSILDEIYVRMTEEGREKMEHAYSQVTDEEFQEERERFMTKEIIRANPDIHIGGLEHVFGDGKGLISNPLYNRIKDRSVTRKKLIEFE